MKPKDQKLDDGVKDDHRIEDLSIAEADLFQFLVEGPELRVRQKSSREAQEIEFERLAVLADGQISEEIKNFVLFTAKIYKATFTQDYYREIFRLKGWKVEGTSIYRKPWLVAKYTKEVIYGRFTKDILRTIELQNPYIVPGIRGFKHFQYLNEQGQNKLEQFISEAVEVMKDSTTWYEFRVKMFNQYKLPYQMDLFN